MRRPVLIACLAMVAVAGCTVGGGEAPRAAGADRDVAPASSTTSTASTTTTTTSTTTTSTRPPRPDYAFPIDGCKASYAREHHSYPATDVFAARGCRFVAPVAGTVDEVSREDRWGPGSNLGGDRGGLSVSLVGVDGARYYGSHLESVADGITPGVEVRAGQVLGRVGSTGSARGIAPHLHFGISWPTRDGIWWVRRGMVPPWPYLDSWRAGGNRSPAPEVRAARADAGTAVPECSSRC